MAQQIIDTVTDHGTYKGDPAKISFTKANENFSELYGFKVSKGYIEGLTIEYVSPNSIRVTAGAAYIPSLDRVLEMSSAITKSGLSLTASAWHRVYLHLNGSTPDIEIATTAPAAPYNGTARTKAGDSSRRYLGAFKTDSSGAIIGFDSLPGGLRLYRISSASFGNFQILNGGTSTSPVDLDCSAYIPATSQLGYFQLQINAGSLTNMMPSGVTASAVADLVVTRGASIGLCVGACRIGNAQKVAYQANDTSSTTYVWIKGYYEDR